MTPREREWFVAELARYKQAHGERWPDNEQMVREYLLEELRQQRQQREQQDRHAPSTPEG